MRRARALTARTHVHTCAHTHRHTRAHTHIHTRAHTHIHTHHGGGVTGLHPQVYSEIPIIYLLFSSSISHLRTGAEPFALRCKRPRVGGRRMDRQKPQRWHFSQEPTPEFGKRCENPGNDGHTQRFPKCRPCSHPSPHVTFKTQKDGTKKKQLSE